CKNHHRSKKHKDPPPEGNFWGQAALPHGAHAWPSATAVHANFQDSGQTASAVPEPSRAWADFGANFGGGRQ
ncbi:unnamed protein product, partial [Polarella glacialis]